MKYVMIQRANGTEFPVFCLAPQTHLELAGAWCRDTAHRPVAAGFCEFLPTGQAIVFGRSHSLQLENRPADAAVISMFYKATVEMARISDGVTGQLAERFAQKSE